MPTEADFYEAAVDGYCTKFAVSRAQFPSGEVPAGYMRNIQAAVQKAMDREVPLQADEFAALRITPLAASSVNQE